MEIDIRLRKELIIDREYDPHIKISSEDVEFPEDLYLTNSNSQHCIIIGVDSGTEIIRDMFAEFCDSVYFSTRYYESTKGQIPTNVLFSRGTDEAVVRLILKPEFFRIEAV